MQVYVYIFHSHDKSTLILIFITVQPKRSKEFQTLQNSSRFTSTGLQRMQRFKGNKIGRDNV